MDDMKIKVESIVNVTQEDIDDIMCSALEEGVAYWCTGVRVVEEYLGKYASEQISRGGTLKLYDKHNNPHKLDKEKLVKGLKMYLEDPERPYNILDTDTDSVGCSKGEYSLDCGMVDGCVADMIIQHAIFEKMVFA